MTLVELQITYCCQDLQIAMVKREWKFQVDTRNKDVVLVDTVDNEWQSTCPFCHREVADWVRLGFPKGDKK